jgi:hypothetical protein
MASVRSSKLALYIFAKFQYSWMRQNCAFVSHHTTIGTLSNQIRATVIDYLQQNSSSQDSTVLYFFCDHRDPSKQSFQDLIYVIVKQLLDQNPECFEGLKHRYVNILWGARGSKVAKKLDNLDYVELIHDLCLRWGSVNLVIDALDECSFLSNFIGGLKLLIAEKSNIRLLLTSRHDVELKRLIAPITTYQLPVVEYMRVDIRTYLSAEVESRLALGSLKLRQDSLAAEIVAALEERADGMFV